MTPPGGIDRLMPASGSVAGLLFTQAERFGDHDLFVLPNSVRDLWDAGQNSWTYGQVAAEVERLSAAYHAAGYGAGDRVALLLENRPAHFLNWLALNSLGASVVPINPQASAEELSYLLEHSEAKLFVRLDGYDRFDAVADALSIPVAHPDLALPEAGAPRAVQAQAQDPDAECALIYTSGTTGQPKGCILSNRYFLNWAHWYSGQRGLIALRPGVERLMTPLPTFHVNAMGHSFMGMLSCGGAQIIVDRFHPRSWWQEAAETHATCFHYLGVMPAILLELPYHPAERSHGLRFGLGGGVHPDRHARFESRFGVPLLEGWAMTETGGAAALCAAEEPRHVGRRCIGRASRPGPAIEAVVVGEDSRELPRGEAGDLLVRASGPDPRRGFFSGYLKNEEATEAAWSGGWFRTGDVVTMDADGFCYFVERKKNIIRRSGENIAASEVEAVISEVPGVLSVAVIAAPDPLREEEVLAAFVPSPGSCPAETAEAIFAACAERLAYFKVPALILPVDSLPTTSTQKVQKAKLRALAESATLQPGCLDLRDRKQKLRAT